METILQDYISESSKYYLYDHLCFYSEHLFSLNKQDISNISLLAEAYLIRKEYSQGYEFLKKFEMVWRKTESGITSKIFYIFGYICYKLNKYGEASLLLNNILNDEHQQHTPYHVVNYVLGLVYKDGGKYKKAYDCFKRVVEDKCQPFLHLAYLKLCDLGYEKKYQISEKISLSTVLEDDSKLNVTNPVNMRYSFCSDKSEDTLGNTPKNFGGSPIFSEKDNFDSPEISNFSEISPINNDNMLIDTITPSPMGRQGAEPPKLNTTKKRLKVEFDSLPPDFDSMDGMYGYDDDDDVFPDSNKKDKISDDPDLIRGRQSAPTTKRKIDNSGISFLSPIIPKKPSVSPPRKKKKVDTPVSSRKHLRSGEKKITHNYPFFNNMMTLVTDYTYYCNMYLFLKLFQLDQVRKVYYASSEYMQSLGEMKSLLAYSYYEKERYQKSFEVYSQMEKDEPWKIFFVGQYSSLLWQLKKKRKLMSLAAKMQRMSPSHIQTAITLGNAASLEEENKLACKYFEWVTIKEPGNIEGHILLGCEYLEGNQTKKAMECFERVNKITNKNYKSWYGMGRVCFRMEDYKGARNHFHRALKIKKSSSVVWTNLAMAEAKMDRKGIALECLKNAAKIERPNPFSLMKQAKLLFDLRRFKESIDILKPMSEEFQNEPKIFQALAENYEKLGIFSKCVECLEAAIFVSNKDSDPIVEKIEQYKRLIEEKTLQDKMEVDIAEDKSINFIDDE